MLADHQMTMCPHCLKCKLCPDDTSIDTVGTATKKQPQEMPGTGEATPKKQKLGECKKSTWKDNPNYNGKLKQLKQTSSRPMDKQTWDNSYRPVTQPSLQHSTHLDSPTTHADGGDYGVAVGTQPAHSCT